MLLEGEEESASPSMVPFLTANAEELKADIALVCDTNMWDRADAGRSRRCCAAFSTRRSSIQAASHDLHSGYYGSAARNPIHVLAKILADLRDENGRVTIPGFYDGVPEITPEQKAQWDDARLRRGRRSSSEIGLKSPAGEKGLLDAGADLGAADRGSERHRRRLYGRGRQDGDPGQGVGEDVVPPGRRTGSGSDPQELSAPSCEARVPADCKAVFLSHGGDRAVSQPTDSPWVQAAQARAFGGVGQARRR